MQGMRIGVANAWGSKFIPQHTYEHFAATAAVSTSQVSKCVRQVALNLESVTFVIAFPDTLCAAPRHNELFLRS